jgi:hypothetical protein
MSQQNTYRELTEEQIKILQNQGCSAQDWSLVKVADGFNPTRVRGTQFFGRVHIGRFTGNVKFAGGLEKPSGIYNATIADCSIGNDARISNIGVHIANYDIGSGACIENVGTMVTRPGASFGNGIKAAVLNEAGGREVVLFDELSAQFAYLMCIHRYRRGLIKKLLEIAQNEAEKVRCDVGKVGPGAQICSTPEIIDVNVGPYAVIKAAASLVNGSVLSSAEAPTIIDSNVVAEDFIIAENASVTGAAHLKKVFVGQGCQIGKQFSAENSLFFSNCEAFNGEACSVFAGPYTVTHHKSTLLIACLFSFYNAGSGTNQSNHMYKLGPVHEGKLERGTKAGSFSYMMWPCRVGPFSVVLGKHTRIFDTSDFPFTHLEADPNGKCFMIPGLYLATAGTLRDAEKWPSRDRRKGAKKRDIISFDILSPYTVGKMVEASSILSNLQDNTDRSVEEISIKGAQMKRVLLRTSQKLYRAGIEMYLFEKVLAKSEKVLDGGIEKIRKAFATEADAVYSRDWVDIGGQLMPKQRLLDVTAAIESGEITDVASFCSEMERIHQVAEKDEWLWVKNSYKEFFGRALETLTKDDLIQSAESYRKTRIKFLKQVLVDAEKDFGWLSRTGFGQDGSAEDLDEDFRQVRGRYDDNRFVKETRDNIEMVERRITEFKEKISTIL